MEEHQPRKLRVPVQVLVVMVAPSFTLLLRIDLHKRLGIEIHVKRKGSEAFAKVEKKAPPSQPGLEPRSSAYAADAHPLELLGPAHVHISSVTPSHPFASASQHKPHPKPT